ncbi:GPI biosynthesis protein family Pig-F-domain-containing protein [Pisolithus croceorrhizus]|nr:GPI biosynthesis protein family Pig-F-domain-containing protein [Pisolithus croceorrhizus]
MPPARARTKKVALSSTASESRGGSFPFFQYASVVGVHVILVGFTALYLPQSTRLFGPLPVRKTDRPQSEFMEALTARPAVTVAWTLAGLCVLQVWWGTWVRKWYFEQNAHGTSDEIKITRAKAKGVWFSRLREAVGFTLLATVVTHIVIVLFGAPLLSHLLQTGLLASTVAILTAFVPALVFGYPSLASDTPALVNRLNWIRLFAELSPRNPVERIVVYPAVGTVVGAWFGAFPIPLDWDRPWQAWPLTPLYGSLAGYIIASLAALAVNSLKWLAQEQLRSVQPSTKYKSS